MTTGHRQTGPGDGDGARTEPGARQPGTRTEPGASTEPDGSRAEPPAPAEPDGARAEPHAPAEPGSLAPGTQAYIEDPSHFGILPGQPWPDDVPHGQDDTWWRYKDDPRGARRAELRIAAFWMLAVVAGVGLATVYVLGGQPQLEGTFLAIGFGGLGTGFVFWARDLLPGHDVTASRGHLHHESSQTARRGATQALGRGLEPLARRPFLGRVLGLVGGVFGLGLLFPLASLGPRTHGNLAKTPWRAGTRMVTESGRPVRPTDIEVNGILTVFPQSNLPLDSATMAQSSSLLINLGPNSGFEVLPGRQGWNLGGLVCFSKICTHAGCPVGLYNTRNHELICPCHQSTFAVLKACKPIFGPAPRSLPQLPIGVDAEGYLVSAAPYDQPVGPGYWSRG